jgi:hypothetical protein
MEWALLLLVFLYMQGDGDVVAGAEDILSTITQGPRVTHAPYDKSTGVVPYSPDGLASQAGVDLETYALARMLASEEGSADNTTKAAIAWASMNYAAQTGRAISSVLLHAVDPNHSGYFGTFINIDRASPYYGENAATGKPNKADRYASTALDPYQGDVDIASGVLSGSIADFTGGATQFDRPAGERNPQAVADKRTAAGAQPVDVPGVDPGLRFWRPAVG